MDLGLILDSVVLSVSPRGKLYFCRIFDNWKKENVFKASKKEPDEGGNRK